MPTALANVSPLSCSAFARRAVARSGLLLLIALIALIAAALAARSADAAQQQNAYAYAYWRWTPQTPKTIFNVDQELNILKAGKSTYWSMPFNTSGGGAGYMGLQSNAASFQGTSGKIALFSWTGATDSNGTPLPGVRARAGCAQPRDELPHQLSLAQQALVPAACLARES